MLRFLIQSIPFNAELNSLQDGISDFTVAFTHHAAGVGSIIMRHPVPLLASCLLVTLAAQMQNFLLYKMRYFKAKIVDLELNQSDFIDLITIKKSSIFS